MEELPGKKEEGNRSMNEQETYRFLSGHDVKSLNISKWKPGQPVLYVLTGKDRDIHYRNKGCPEDEIPSIARLDAPIELEPFHPDRRGQNKRLFKLYNEKGRIDYFAINSKTGEVKRVRSSKKFMTYLSMNTALFEPADHLFPKYHD